MSPRTEAQYQQIRTEKKKKIRDAALHVFAQNGYDGSSIAQIAKEASVSKGLIYNYFEGKDDILFDLVTDLFNNVFDRLNLPEDNLTDEDMRHFIDVQIDLVVEDPPMYRLFFNVLIQQQVIEMVMKEFLPKYMPMIALFTDYYTRKGYENPIAMMRFISAAIDGIQMHIVLDVENFPVEDVRKILYKIALIEEQ